MGNVSCGTHTASTEARAPAPPAAHKEGGLGAPTGASPAACPPAAPLVCALVWREPGLKCAPRHGCRGSQLHPAMGAGAPIKYEPCQGRRAQIGNPPWEPGRQCESRLGRRHGSRGPNLGSAMGAGVQMWVLPWEPGPKFGSRHGSRDPNLGPAMGSGTQFWVPALHLGSHPGY